MPAEISDLREDRFVFRIPVPVRSHVPRPSDAASEAAGRPRPAISCPDELRGRSPDTESERELDESEAFGGQGRSLLMQYERGSRGTGNRKVFFGDSPTGRVVRRGESFDDIYWRIDVKHQPGWTGGGLPIVPWPINAILSIRYACSHP